MATAGVFDIELQDVDNDEHTDDDESIELDDVSSMVFYTFIVTLCQRLNAPWIKQKFQKIKLVDNCLCNVTNEVNCHCCCIIYECECVWDDDGMCYVIAGS